MLGILAIERVIKGSNGFRILRLEGKVFELSLLLRLLASAEEGAFCSNHLILKEAKIRWEMTNLARVKPMLQFAR